MRVDGHTSASTEDSLRRISQLMADSPVTARAISAAVAIAETRVDDIIDSLIAADRVSDSALGRMLVSKSGRNFNQNWKSRHEVLEGGFGLTIDPTSVRQEMELVIDVRNALAHGDGRLTEWQIRNLAAGIELKRKLERSLKLRVDGRDLKIEDESITLALQTIRNYLIALDEGIWHRTSRLQQRGVRPPPVQT